MGIDIYMYAEAKKNNKWKLVSGYEKNIEYDEERIEVIKKELRLNSNTILSEEDKYYLNIPKYIPKNLINYRNNALNTIFANSGRDAGVFDFISEPKGLPNDISKALKKYAETWKDPSGEIIRWDNSSLTLQEILAFDWYKEVKLFGYTEKKFVKFFGDGNKSLTLNEIFENKIQVFGYLSDGEKVSWLESYKDIASEFYYEVLPKLKSYGEPDTVRIVFWFCS